jgi:hypothetical protein
MQCKKHKECYDVYFATLDRWGLYHSMSIQCNSEDEWKVRKLVNRYDANLEKAIRKIEGARISIGVDDENGNHRKEEEN